MNFELEREFSKAPVISEVDELKAEIDSLKPLPPDVEGRVMQKLRLEWNYNSNAIEGNKLNYGETVAFLMTGITAKGKPLKDYLDIKGHNEAINFLLSIVKETRSLTEADIRALHKMILVEPYEVDALTLDGQPTKKTIKIGEYKTQANHVRTATGETHYYTTPEETPAKMQQLMEWYHIANEDQSIHPIIVAALFHHEFVEIHPFDDGNGRLSRILMNLVLMQGGYPPAIIKMDDRQNYYALLSQADTGDSWPFVEYIIERAQSSLLLYLKAIKGGDIDEDEDIDKEIALFKVEINNSLNINLKRSLVVNTDLMIKSIEPFIKQVLNTANKFNDLFFYTALDIDIQLSNGTRNIYENVNLTNFLNTLKAIYTHAIIVKLDLKFHYKEFRNATNSFDVDNTIFYDFNEYDYVLLAAKNELEIRKKYHEELTKDNRSILLKHFIANIQQKIKEAINQ